MSRGSKSSGSNVSSGKGIGSKVRDEGEEIRIRGLGKRADTKVNMRFNVNVN